MDTNLEKQLLEKLLTERADLDQHIALLQKRLGLNGTTESNNASPQPSITVPDLVSAGVNRGEFYGMSRPQAASALLKKMGKPLTTTQIFEALRETGFDVSGRNALGGLYTALKRAADITKVAPNTWGLREWYPHAKEPKKRPSVISNDPSALPLDDADIK